MNTKQKQISFDASDEDLLLIYKIQKRALTMIKEAGGKYDAIDCNMDLVACHANGNPLRLQALLDADDFNFAHDIFGIRRHLNRQTGELMNCFSPRFSE